MRVWWWGPGGGASAFPFADHPSRGGPRSWRLGTEEILQLSASRRGSGQCSPWALDMVLTFNNRGRGQWG